MKCKRDSGEMEDQCAFNVLGLALGNIRRLEGRPRKKAKEEPAGGLEKATEGEKSQTPNHGQDATRPDAEASVSPITVQASLWRASSVIFAFLPA
jgi:hypothetical protein